jgi:hypothetical protein
VPLDQRHHLIEQIPGEQREVEQARLAHGGHQGERTTGSTLEVGVPKPLFKTRPSQEELRQAYSTVDGEHFLVRTLDETTAPAIAWLVNWRALVEP